ncbi:hypothetical protein QYF36_000009 [Acer negundo]|nr:hypothetical protein QYF36_000009 [Acer negundo]
MTTPMPTDNRRNHLIVQGGHRTAVMRVLVTLLAEHQVVHRAPHGHRLTQQLSQIYRHALHGHRLTTAVVADLRPRFNKIQQEIFLLL